MKDPFGIPVTLKFPKKFFRNLMAHSQQKLLEVMVTEAFTCFRRGDHEDGKALLYSFFDKFDSSVLEEAAKDKKFIYELIKEKNSKNEVNAMSALFMLDYLKNYGVEL
tara:strand:+ start:229 stop:552 length:324 start_codon:yes stop_codon:yes gene_type:complete